MRFFLAAAAFAMISSTAQAVDGYKDLKFGATIEQARATKICTIGANPSKEDGVEIYSCSDLKFNGKNTMAFFYFVSKKLLRVGFYAGEDASDLIALNKTLGDKYGPPSTPLDGETAKAYDLGKANSFSIGYDHDTVIVRALKIESGDAVMMIYTSKQYDKSVVDEKKRSMASDL